MISHSLSKPDIIDLTERAVSLLSELIGIQSLSKEEDKTADHLSGYLGRGGVEVRRKGNNIWSFNRYFDPAKPTILLNSHHDTVKPNKGYTLDPYKAIRKDGKLYGLGSNDAGGCLVSLLITFLHFVNRDDLPFNIIFAATAEEEISGSGGVESILEELKPIEFGIVGEPTEMKMAMAEKGLMVLDCHARGISGHAARDTGENAIYKAMRDIEWVRTYQFPNVSDYLGPVKMTVTMIESGYQHNVVPDECHFVVDVRSTDRYSNQELADQISNHIESEAVPRSTRLNPSNMPENSLISIVADELGIHKFGSPTTSDQAVMDFPTLKMGPGRSERSHTADEFIYERELTDGISGYIHLLEKLFERKSQNP